MSEPRHSIDEPDRSGTHADGRTDATRVPPRDADPTVVGAPRSTEPTVTSPRSADTVATPAPEVVTPDRHEIVAREKAEFGGFKFGTAFFGWLTATGMAVLLTALVSAIGAGVGLGVSGSAEEAAQDATSNASTVGIVGAIALAVILFVAYYCGGYVAGRMARFSGAKQGVAVWIWAVVVAIVVAIVTAIAGSQFDVLRNVNSFPRIPIGEGDLTVLGIVTIVAALLIPLLAAVLGGLAGMRFHRRVDRVGLGK